MISILHGDCRDVLPTLPASSVHCCVTSPPYWGLRDFGHPNQIGLEPTPEVYVAALVGVFREVHRVLRDDGTLWLNLGDCYAGSRAGEQGAGGQMANRSVAAQRCRVRKETRVAPGLKPKDLVGIPWRVAFALQADGWYLRSDVIWHKPAPMPESVTDRPTRAHEYVFLLAKSERYHYDTDAIKEPATGRDPNTTHRNRRDVWTVASKPYAGAHFAVMPPDLVAPCVLAGCPLDGTVLDPFAGSGTVGEVALSLGRRATLIEIAADYVRLIENRTGAAWYRNFTLSCLSAIHDEVVMSPSRRSPKIFDEIVKNFLAVYIAECGGAPEIVAREDGACFTDYRVSDAFSSWLANWGKP